MPPENREGRRTRDEIIRSRAATSESRDRAWLASTVATLVGRMIEGIESPAARWSRMGTSLSQDRFAAAVIIRTNRSPKRLSNIGSEMTSAGRRSNAARSVIREGDGILALGRGAHHLDFVAANKQTQTRRPACDPANRGPASAARTAP